MFRQDDFDVRDALRVIARRRAVVLSSVLAFVGLALVLNTVTRPVFRTSARIAIQPAPSHSALTGATVESPTSNSENLALLTTAERILNRGVLENVATEMRSAGIALRPAKVPAASPAEALREDVDALLQLVSVRPLRDTRLVDIQAEHSNPTAAAQLANSVASQFVRRESERRHAADGGRMAALRAQMEDVRKVIETSERELYGSRSSGLALSEERGRQITGAASELSASMVRTSADRHVVESQLDRIHTFRASAAPDWSNPPVQTPALDDLYRQLQKAETDMLALRRLYREQSPEVIALETQQQALREAMKRELRKAASDLVGQREVLMAREQGMQQTIAANEHTLQSLSDNSYKYSTVQSQLGTQRELYTLLLKKVQEQEIAQTIDPASVEVVQAAPVPLEVVRPRKAVNLALGLVLGLVFGAGLALARESLKRTIRTPKDVVHELHLPVVGMIPRRP